MAFLRNLKTLDSFHNRNFRAYYFGMAGQWAAMSMQMVIQSLLLYRLTGSMALLGTMALATALPMVAVALFAGVATDRFPKKYVIQFSQAGMGLIAFAIAILLITGVISKNNEGSWLFVLGGGVLHGALQALINTARHAIIPELVEKDKLMNAISLNNMGMQVFQFVSPMVGGLLVDYVGFSAVYFLMGGLCLVAVIVTNAVPKVQPDAREEKTRVLRDVAEGLKYIKGNTSMLVLVVFTILCIFIASPMTTLLSVFTEDILDVGGTGLGILQGMMAVGAFIGSIIFASFSIKKRGIIMIVLGGMLGLVQAIFSFSSIWILSLIMMIIVGFGRVGHMTPAVALVQNYADKRYLGRVLSTLSLGMGLGNIMAFINGVVAEGVGIQLSVGGSSAVLVLIAIGILLFVPSIRKLD